MCRNLNKKRLHFCEKCSLYLIMCPGFQICVGVDAHIDPLGTIEFAEDFRKTGFSAGAMWASTLTNLLEEVNDFVEVNIRQERSC